MKMNEQGFYTNYDLWHVPFWKTAKFFWGAIILFCITFLAVAFVIIYLYAQKKRKETIEQRTLKELQQLECLMHMHPPKKIFTTMTDIIKKYIEQRFACAVCHKTDAELMQFLNENDSVPTNSKHLMTTLFEGAEIIKFSPDPAQFPMMNYLDNAKLFVQQTTPEKK